MRRLEGPRVFYSSNPSFSSRSDLAYWRAQIIHLGLGSANRVVTFSCLHRRRRHAAPESVLLPGEPCTGPVRLAGHRWRESAFHVADFVAVLSEIGRQLIRRQAVRDMEEIEHRCFPSPLQESGFHENIRTLVEVQREFLSRMH